MKITKSRLKEIVKEEYSSILNEAVGNFMPANLAYIRKGLEDANKLLMDGEGISDLNKEKVREILAAFETFKTLVAEALGPEPEEGELSPEYESYPPGAEKGW